MLLRKNHMHLYAKREKEKYNQHKDRLSLYQNGKKLSKPNSTVISPRKKHSEIEYWGKQYRQIYL